MNSLAPDSVSPRKSTLLDRIAGLPWGIPVGAALAIFFTLSLHAMWGESITMDEGIHLSSGYTHLVARDYRLSPETAPLAKTLAAVPLLFSRVRLPENESLWRSAEMGFFGFHFLYRSGNDPDRLLWSARLTTLFWSALLIVSVFAVARDVFGARGGIVSLALIVFCPTLLAHGHLVTQDVPVAALFFLTVVAFWKLRREDHWRWAAYTGVLLGGSLAAKFSAVVLPFILLVILAAEAWRPSAPLPSISTKRWLTYMAGVLLCAGAVIWAVYGFRYAGSADQGFRFDWEAFPLTEKGLSSKLVRAAAEARLLPEAWLYGFHWQVEHNARGHAAYALGQASMHGWVWYFPLAFLVKTPVAALALQGWAGWKLARGLARKTPVPFVLLLPPLAFLIFLLFSQINIGIRYLLPAYPFIAALSGVVASASVAETSSLWRRHLVPSLLGLNAAACLLAAPFYLAFFNAPSTALFYRHFLLADSNLDWGQDLGRLKRWMDENRVPRVKLAYFGFGSPAHLGLEHEVLPADNRYSHVEEGLRPAASFSPGDYVAISATAYIGAFDVDVEIYRRRFRGLKPVAIIGHSILVYQIPRGFPPGPIQRHEANR